MADKAWLQIQVDPEFKEALQRIANNEVRTITAVVLTALREKYPQLKKGNE